MCGLIDYVNRYAARVAISIGYHEQLEIAARRLVAYTGCDKTRNLDAETVNRWLAAELKKTSPRTAQGKRRAIHTIWRAAHDDGLAPPVGKLLRIRAPELVPVAFLADELRKLLAAAEKTEQRLWWRSFVLAAYDSALRLGDLLSIESDWISPSGTITMVQHKTGHQHRIQFRPETLEAIRESLGNSTRRLIWPMWCSRRQWFREFSRLRLAAGVNPRLGTKGIRRASASYVEAAQPGAASRHLGHRSPELASRYYLDRRICGDAPTLPPGL